MKMQELCVAALFVVAGCSPSDNGNSSATLAKESGSPVKEIATVPASITANSATDLTKFFGTEKPFCDYANNLDILTPKGVIQAPIKTKQDFWESSLARFDGTLHGLKVVGVASFRLEGVGANAVIFDETNERVWTILGPIYGKSHTLAKYFPGSIQPDNAVACPDCETSGDHPQFTALRDGPYSKEFYGLGMSAIECGFFD
jgi:hypothetical protein